MKNPLKIIIILFCIITLIVVVNFTKTSPREEVKILFVGDIMFDRTIRKHINTEGFDHIFSCSTSILKSYDLVVGNLEGTITSLPSKSLKTLPGDQDNMKFTFPIETALNLANNNIKIVSIGNNHIYDFGGAGLTETRSALLEAGVAWFGDPSDPTNISYVYDKNGIKIALVNYNQFLGSNGVEKTLKEIESQKEIVSTIVVFAHWGEEYTEPTVFMKNTAHKFIDAGADIIVGAHPHVIQEKEVYKGKEIYYSLGNFIFDQYWNDKVNTGLGVVLSISGKKLETKTMNFKINRDGTTCPI